MSPQKSSIESQNSINIYNILLKIGLIFFMFGILFNLFIIYPELQNVEIFIKITAIIVFLSLSILTFAIPKRYYNYFAFFFIFTASLFKIIIRLSHSNVDIEIITVYFLVIVMALYLLKKTTGHSHRH